VKSIKDKQSAISTATKLVKEKYPEALVAFVGGSFNRNEQTETSDIDLVLVFKNVEQAWRESFFYDGWPIEVFGHDEETLKYFFYEIDGKDGIPSLPHMVSEGPAITDDESLANRIRQTAISFINKGPAKLTEDEMNNHRYTISDLLDDLRAPKNQFEGIIISGKLHGILAYYYFRYNGHWGAGTKHIPRQMIKLFPELFLKWESSFKKAFSGDFKQLIELTENILDQTGGYLFEGYKRDAPKEWRLK